MLKLFNALQFVSLFALMPYGIQWVHGADFVAHTAAMWGCMVIYAVMFCMTVGCTVASFDRI